MYETEDYPSLEKSEVNNTPQGFVYHWPKYKYEELYKYQNWYINFETLTMYIDGTKRTYEILITEHKLEMAGFTYDKTQSTYKTIVGAYNDYIAEVILLG